MEQVRHTYAIVGPQVPSVEARSVSARAICTSSFQVGSVSRRRRVITLVMLAIETLVLGILSYSTCRAGS